MCPTLPSSGHATAGHNISLRVAPRRRCVPLMANVGLLEFVVIPPVTRAVRPAAAGEPLRRLNQVLHLRSGARGTTGHHLDHLCGLSVLRRPAHGRLVAKCAMGSRPTESRAACGAFLQSGALAVSGPAQQQALIGVHANVPNPAIERTRNGGAQSLASCGAVPPLCAAHGERWANTHFGLHA